FKTPLSPSIGGHHPVRSLYVSAVADSESAAQQLLTKPRSMRGPKQSNDVKRKPSDSVVRRFSEGLMATPLARAIVRRASSQRRQNAAEMFHVQVSRPVFALFWLLILVAHAMCGAFFTAAAYLYPYIMKRSLGLNLRLYALQLPASAYTYIAYTYAVIAVPHGYFILRMVLYSIWYRRLVFQSKSSTRISSPKLTSALQSKLMKSRFCSASLSRSIFYWRKWLFGHTGLFGLGGQHFRTIFLIQEAVEIALQTTQAHRMSCWLPREWLNRLYVILLVFNCWSTTVIQRFTGNNLPLERLLVFLAGLITDLMALIAIPVVLTIPYARIYSYDRGSFIRSYWYDDVWLINMVNESQLILVTSVWDLASKMVFSVTLLMTFMVVKSLVRPVSSQTAAIVQAVAPLAPSVSTITESPVETFSPTTAKKGLMMTTPVELFTNGSQDTSKRKESRPISPAATSNFLSPRFFAFQDNLVHWGHRVFLLWGLLVLIIQIHADSLVAPALCGLQVRPWLQLKPSCSLLEAAMDDMNQPMLAHIVFRHCANLQMPPNLKLLNRLIGLKIYNSTLTRWEQDAALTNTNHPLLTFMFLVRVNMTEVPQGIQTHDYPKRLTDWPKGIAFAIESAKFTHVPEVLVKMEVGYLGFNNNNISDIPIGLFTHPNARSIWLNGNPVSRLLSGSSLPSWISSSLLAKGTLLAAGTPLCKSISAWKAAGSNSSVLSAHLLKVFTKTSCTAQTGDLFTYYPLVLESKHNVGAMVSFIQYVHTQDWLTDSV
ncbi:hypothetical protein PybrP1_008108, partial [[Pythium] brassicae (nom. inval.)]